MTLRRRLGLTVLLTAIPLVVGLIWLWERLELRSFEDGLRTFAVTHMESQGRERCEENPTTWGGILGGRPPPRGRRNDDGPGPRRGRGPGRGRGRPPPDGFRPPRRGPGIGEDFPFDPPHRDERRPPDQRRGAMGDPPAGMPPRPQRYEIWAYAVDYLSDNPRAPKFPQALRANLDAGEDCAGESLEVNGRPSYQVAVPMAWTTGPCAIVIMRKIGVEPPATARELVWPAIILCGVLLFAVLLTSGPIVRRIRRLTTQVRESAAERYATPVDASGTDEIAGLARAFNDAGDELRAHVQTIEEREQTLRRFLGNTTHDVMLPLTVLQGHLAAMRKQLEAGEDLDPLLVNASLEEAQYMGSLVHNLSAVAKLEGASPTISRYPVDLVELVERATARQKTIAGARGVELNHAVPEGEVVVEGDITLIEQAVSNVIHNAVRYNEDGGHVAVVLRNGSGRFSLRVLDDGPGMPEELLARLPERRFRGEEARSRHPEGSGLGLHIARDVAHHHGFDLAFRPSEHGGLEVEFSGPLYEGSDDM